MAGDRHTARLHPFTLIEMVMVIGIMAMVMGILGSTFVASMRTWSEAEADMAMTRVGQEVMESICQGVTYPRGLELGIEDALAVAEGNGSSLSLLPHFRLHLHSHNEGEVILPVPHQAGSAPPFAVLAGSQSPLALEYSRERNSIRPLKPLPEGVEAWAFYRPEGENIDSFLSFSFDASGGRILRRYGGQEHLLPLHDYGCRIESMVLRYLVAGEREMISEVKSGAGLIQGIAIELKVSKRDRVQTFRRTVHLANAGRSILISAAQKQVTRIPAPSRIRSLSLRYPAGAAPGKVILLSAGDWRCQITFQTGSIVKVRHQASRLGEVTVTMHTAEGIQLLNPDMIMDADGSRTSGRGASAEVEVRAGDTLKMVDAGVSLRYLDTDGNGEYDFGEPLFHDRNQDHRYSEEDGLLVGGDIRPGTVARAFRAEDSVLAYHSTGREAGYREGMDLVFDANADLVFGGPYYDCLEGDASLPLSVDQFDIEGVTLIVR